MNELNQLNPGGGILQGFFLFTRLLKLPVISFYKSFYEMIATLVTNV